MSDMITLAQGFQYSVNIGYDLNSNEKLQNFIPTKFSLQLLEDILASTNENSTNRARVLIGAYGKGKSHIVLTILSILMKKDLPLFTNLMPVVEKNPALQHALKNYYDSKNKILPVVISGNSTSMTQAFLLALQRALADNDLLDIMPESNYKAAKNVIQSWKKSYPQTFSALKKLISEPVKNFCSRLENFDISAYEEFEKVYPQLTSGSVFNPFLGFDVVELYTDVVKALEKKGYTGIFVVYDEFSKYLETNITSASVSDVKMLQDFAEKCNRSADKQMHILLISHKEIANYIDKLPQKKVDGWRGVSERFTHIHLNNNFMQTYGIISTVIKKNNRQWNSFCRKQKKSFEALEHRYRSHSMFKDAGDDFSTVVSGCYPLHPVTTFILPRLSEKVAQNERTLFTFLSASSSATLSSFLESCTQSEFCLLTPDLIFDYFEPLFKKEAYSGTIHSCYVLTSSILEQLGEKILEKKIVKTISLIYLLEQFERIVPTIEEIIGIFSTDYAVNEIQNAVDDLIDREFVVFLKRSNGFLKLKKSSGVDVRKEISDLMQIQALKSGIKDVLASLDLDYYMYPARYNDEHDMTRFFAIEFIEQSEISDSVDWKIKSESIESDGVIYAVLPDDEDGIASLTDTLCKTSHNAERCIFIVPKQYQCIETVSREFMAVSVLRDRAAGDTVLYNEYDTIYDDLQEVIKTFINAYICPENGKAYYIHSGVHTPIHRKAEFSELMSKICDDVYSLTPVINNEALNRNEITRIASNSRGKIISGLLRAELENNLGLSGTTQEVSIMRSTLIRTGILYDDSGRTIIHLKTGNDKMDNVLAEIEKFITSGGQAQNICFKNIYDVLCLSDHHIGLKRGLIPIYIAVVLHKYRQQVVISNRIGQVPVNADTLLQINAEPQHFFLSYVEWNEEKDEYLDALSNAFSEYVISSEKSLGSYEFAANAIKRWYLALPKYSKEAKKDADGKKIPKRHRDIISTIRQNTSGYDLLFKTIPGICGYKEEFNSSAADCVIEAKKCFDSLLAILKMSLISQTKDIFTLAGMERQAKRMSLSSVCQEWCETLDSRIFEQVFPNGAEKCFELFMASTNDEYLLVARLAKLCTGLQIEDWSSDTVTKYVDVLEEYKKTGENFHANTYSESNLIDSAYQITFVNENGESQTKRFDRVGCSKRGQLLMNQIKSSLDAMGRSISEQEKRQVLMEVLKNLF